MSGSFFGKRAIMKWGRQAFEIVPLFKVPNVSARLVVQSLRGSSSAPHDRLVGASLSVVDNFIDPHWQNR